jgi:phosphate-selective porin OprO/OprP
MAAKSYPSRGFVGHAAKSRPEQAPAEIGHGRPSNVLRRPPAGLLALFILSATTVGAEPAPVPALEEGTSFQSAPVSLESYERLLHRIEALEARETMLEPTPEPEPSDFELSRENWKVKLGGHVQLDYITWPNADPAIDGADDYFNFRRLRLVADGAGYGQFDFRLQMTLEPGEGSHESRFASPDVKDAYLSMNEIPWIGRIRVGNFFVPFSLEQVTNDTNNIFNERSIPTQSIFAADREVGIAFYNRTDDKNVTWSGGFFFDDLSETFKTRIDDNQGYRLSGRLTWLPYYDEASNGRHLVHTGVGVLHTDDHDEVVRFRARPQVQRGPVLIDSGGLPADTYTTGNLELAVVWGPVALQNEAFLSRVNVPSGDPAHVGGAYSHLSWFLTGENRIFERFGQHGAQFGRNVPDTNLFLRPGCHGWGAWEAKTRCSYLDLTDADAGRYTDLTVGFNWYWSDRTRIMFDWIHPWTSSETTFGETSSDLLATRFDFNW